MARLAARSGPSRTREEWTRWRDFGVLSIWAGVFGDFAGLAGVAEFAAFFIGQEYFFRVGSKARKSRTDGLMEVDGGRARKVDLVREETAEE